MDHFEDKLAQENKYPSKNLNLGVVGVGFVLSFCFWLAAPKILLLLFSGHILTTNSWHILAQFAPTAVLCASDILTLYHVGNLTFFYCMNSL